MYFGDDKKKSDGNGDGENESVMSSNRLSHMMLQSLPSNKHNEVKAKPSICLFLLKSEPWDKHIMLIS